MCFSRTTPVQPQTDAPELCVDAFLHRLAHSYGETSAIIGDLETLSFRQLLSKTRRITAALEGLGIGAGDRIAIWLPNTPDWLVLALACGRIGAIALAINTRLRSTEIADLLSRSGAKTLVLWPGFRDIPFLDILSEVSQSELSRLECVILYGDSAVPLPQAISSKRIVTYAEMAALRSDDRTRPPQTNSDWMMFTTSGTTSRPKFVVHTQQAIIAHSKDAALAFGYDAPQSVGMNVMPLCGVIGFSQTMAALSAGAPTVLPPVFNAEKTALALRQYSVTHINSVDTVFNRVLACTSDTPAFPSLRVAAFGAFDGSPEDFLRHAMTRGMPSTGFYGMTETQGLFSLQPFDAPPTLRARGGGNLVSPEGIVRVRDVNSGQILPHGELGAIEFYSPNIMKRYFEDPVASEAAFTKDGFLRTGDSGYTVNDRNFIFMARMGDTLRLGGFLVSPVEIAERIESHPSIAACQVVGAPTDRGIMPVAFVISKSGAGFKENDIIEHCARGLANYKVPIRVFPVDEFPSTPGVNGSKVQRHVLREWSIELLRGSHINT
jgi:fatty-acyl-CoA synthase